MLAGIHNDVLKAVLEVFYWRFVPEGRVLWVNENDEPLLAVRDELHQLGVSLLRPRSLPTVVINDEGRDRLALIDVADLLGLMTENRCEVLKGMFGGSRSQLILVNAFRSRTQFQALAAELPWDSVVWFSDEPNHLIHFDGRNLFGPASN